MDELILLLLIMIKKSGLQLFKQPNHKSSPRKIVTQSTFPSSAVLKPASVRIMTILRLSLLHPTCCGIHTS